MSEEENAFFNKNYSFICEYCKNAKASLEYEDKLSSCMEGFLYSARTYRKYMGKFRVYAEKCMSEHIEKTRRTLAKQKQCEMYNFSLDKKISSDDNEATYADFICADTYDCFSSADLNQMISKLDKSGQQICRLFYMGYKEKEICEMLDIDAVMLRKRKAEIGNVLSEFEIA